jgi:hypothetical protein
VQIESQAVAVGIRLLPHPVITFSVVAHLDEEILERYEPHQYFAQGCKGRTECRGFQATEGTACSI